MSSNGNYVGDCLGPNDSLYPGQALLSPNGQYQLVMQQDNNLCIYQVGNGQALWATATNDSPVAKLTMQEDGNLALLGDQGQIVWQTGSSVAYSVLRMQSDGNLVIYGPGNPTWATATNP